MLIAESLARARAEHLVYRRLSADSKNTKTLEMAQAVQRALQFRTDAHLDDTQHADPAWVVDAQAMNGQTNDALMAFYVHYLAPAAPIVPHGTP